MTYTTGTVSITNNTSALTGVGTSWTTSGITSSWFIQIGTDLHWYPVASVGSDTSITLGTVWNGTTKSGVTYNASSSLSAGSMIAPTLPISSGITGLGSGIATALASSLNGTGNIVGSASPIFTGAVSIAATGNFYQNLGANVNRFSDRVFIGAARLQDGTATGAQDYISANIPQGPTTAIAQQATLSTIGAIGILAGSRSSDAPGTGTEGCIAVSGIVVNDATGANAQVAFASYFEAQQKAGAGFTATIECDSVNQSGAVNSISPYNIFAGNPCVNLWVAAGGGRAGVANSSAALVILDNNTLFDKGIVFQAGCIASNEAIALGSGHALQWWGSTTQATGAISSVQTTSTAGIVLTDTGTAIGNIPGGVQAGLFVGNTAGAVNYLAATPAATGNSPTLAAVGTNANVSLLLTGQGTGGAAVHGTGTNDSAPSGYVGEYVTGSSSAAAITSNILSNATSISLTAGDWDVSGVASFVAASGTIVSSILVGISTTSATLGAFGSFTQIQASFIASSNNYITSPVCRISLGTTTTVYLVASAAFTTSTMTAGGFIRARRTR